MTESETTSPVGRIKIVIPTSASTPVRAEAYLRREPFPTRRGASPYQKVFYHCLKSSIFWSKGCSLIELMRDGTRLRLKISSSEAAQTKVLKIHFTGEKMGIRPYRYGSAHPSQRYLEERTHDAAQSSLKLETFS